MTPMSVLRPGVNKQHKPNQTKSDKVGAKKKYGHTWHRMSLLRTGVNKQHKPNQTKSDKVSAKKSHYPPANHHASYLSSWAPRLYHYTVSPSEVANFCAAMDTLIEQDGYL